MARDRVSLTVPARGEYARTVRMTAAALVSRMGLTYDEVDDVRMAAEEAFVYAVDTLADDAQVTIDFELDDVTLDMEISLGSETDASDEEVERRALYATFILQSVCDSYELTSDQQGNKFLRLHKAAGTVDAG